MRLALSAVLFAWSLLAVFRIPHGALWKPAVAATEWGHVLAALALLAAVPWTRDRAGIAASVIAALAAGLFASPVLRARGVDPNAELTAAFGHVPGGDRPAPFRVRDLAGIGASECTVRTEVLEGTRRVDLYGVGSGSPRPLLVAIHGGSWNSGDRTQLPEVYRWLAAHGWAVAAIEYRLAPAHRFPAQVDDVREAIASLRSRAAELAIDPERVVLYGRSAGAHLALLAAYGDRSVRGVVALYAPSDLNWSWDHPTHPWILDTPGTLSEFVGGPRDAMREQYTAASPYSQVAEGVAPTMLVHGGRDELVFAEQTERLAARLREHRVPTVTLRLPWATHGCEANLAGPSGQLLLYTLERFLRGVTSATGARLQPQ